MAKLMKTMEDLPVGRQVHLVAEMASWLGAMRPWQVISHLTFPWEASVWSAKRCYEKFMSKELRGTEFFYSPEPNPNREGFHIHALWYCSKEIERRLAWSQWFQRYGRARIEPVRSNEDVTNYCSKYVVKEAEWWGIKLFPKPSRLDRFALHGGVV